MKYEIITDEIFINNDSNNPKSFNSKEFIKLFWVLNEYVSYGLKTKENRLNLIKDFKETFKTEGRSLKYIIDNLIKNDLTLDKIMQKYSIDNLLKREIIYRKEKIYIVFDPKEIKFKTYWKNKKIIEQKALNIEDYDLVIENTKEHIDKIFDFPEHRWEREYLSARNRIIKTEDPAKRYIAIKRERENLLSLINKKWKREVKREKKRKAQFKLLEDTTRKELHGETLEDLKIGIYHSENGVFFVDILDNGIVLINRTTKNTGRTSLYEFDNVIDAKKYINKFKMLKTVSDSDQNQLIDKNYFKYIGIDFYNSIPNENKVLIRFYQDGYSKSRIFNFERDINEDEIRMRLINAGINAHSIHRVF